MVSIGWLNELSTRTTDLFYGASSFENTGRLPHLQHLGLSLSIVSSHLFLCVSASLLKNELNKEDIVQSDHAAQ